MKGMEDVPKLTFGVSKRHDACRSQVKMHGKRARQAKGYLQNHMGEA